jgi:hypothetical protein
MLIISFVAQEFTVELSQRFQLNRRRACTIAQYLQACERFDHFLITIEEEDREEARFREKVQLDN